MGETTDVKIARIEEQIDNEPEPRIYEVSHDFLEILYDKVHKINH